MPPPSLLQRLKNRTLAQWALAYLAAAFVVFQLLDALETPLGLTATVQQGVLAVVVVGFFLTLVLAWYHGEKGRQRVSGPELLMVAALLVIAGVALSMLPGREEEAGPSETGASAAVDDNRPSVAVLPFDNLSPDPNDAYIADGMQEEITAKLSLISGLRVISRTSVMQYRETKPATPRIAEELGTDFVVEGSARLSGGQVLVTVQLIDAARDEHLWAEDYDRALSAEDLFEIEGDVARQIAFSVGVALTPQDRDLMGRVLTANTEAYLLYIQGKEAFLRERQGSNMSSRFRSTRLFEEAVEADPEFALARAHLALALLYENYDQAKTDRAKQEAELALSLMPGLAEARMALGRYFVRAGQWEDAVRQFQAAAEENPNLAVAVQQLGEAQNRAGDFDAGLRTLERAERLDPRNPLVLVSLTNSYVFAHRYDDALRTHLKREEVYPSTAAVHYRVVLHLWRGEIEQARAAVSELLAGGPAAAAQFYMIIPGNPHTVGRRILTRSQRRLSFESYIEDVGQAPCTSISGVCIRKAIHEEEAGSKAQARILWDSLAMVLQTRPAGTWADLSDVIWIYQGLGDKEAAIRTAESFYDRYRGVVYTQGPRAGIQLARVLAHFGEHDRAIDLLEELLPSPSWLSVPMLEVDPIWDPLRDEPRFQALLEKYRDDVVH